MIQLYKRMQRMRENYVDTIAKLYEYATTAYAKNQYTQWYDTKEGGYTYQSFKSKCDSLSKKLTQYGIGAGDKVAILSQSMPNWSVAFFSVVPFGRIAIPILPDSSENEVTNIINHSESKVLFVSQRLIGKVSQEVKDKMTLIFDLDTFEMLKSDDDKFTCDGRTTNPTPDDIATIIYTSGTTGSAKGVVLSHRNLSSNVITCYHSCKRTEKDRWLSVLPMAHTLEMTLSMLYPMYCGATVYYLPKPPVASLLMKALKIVKPTTMLTVPMIIEKVYKGSVLPTIKKSRTLTWMNEHMNGLMCKIIGMKIKKTFGGHMSFYGIGGAKLDPEVERFLLKAGFPYAIGYGLTETSPLLGYSMNRWRAVGSFGYPVYNVKLKLHNVDPQTGEGEVVAKGPNVMLGYYKNDEATAESFTSDGWMKTGDMGIVDSDGYLFIKGRCKSMLLGPSGQNIYPEEIESAINNMPYVIESLVIDDGGKLIALIYPDMDLAERDKLDEAALKQKMEENIAAVNIDMPNYSKLAGVRIMPEEFEKTPKKSIKRFLYQEAKG